MSNSIKELFHGLGSSSNVFSKSIAIIFVKTRAAVKLLSILLTTHFITKNLLRIKTFINISNHRALTSNISNSYNLIYCYYLNVYSILSLNTKNLSLVNEKFISISFVFKVKLLFACVN